MTDTPVTQPEDVCELLDYNHETASHLRMSLKDADIEGMSQLFKALSDPTRMKIAYLLLQQRELCVCDFAAILDCSIASASHHLRQLKQLNITKSRKKGKNVYYSLKDHHIQTLILMTMEHLKEKDCHD